MPEKSTACCRHWAWIIAPTALLSVGCLAIQWYRCRLNGEAARIAKLVGVIPGARVAEVGAGKGNMAFRLARRLGSAGILLAAEIDHHRLKTLENKVRTGSVRNVTVLRASATDCGLPRESCTGVYMRLAYHHLTHPREMARSLHSALQPGGVLAIIDFPPRLLLKPFTPAGVPRNRGGHGVRKEIVIRELRSVGFRLLREVEDWPSPMYCLLFQKVNGERFQS